MEAKKLVFVETLRYPKIRVRSSGAGVSHMLANRPCKSLSFRTCPIHILSNSPFRLRLVGGLEPWNFMTFHSVGMSFYPN